MRPSPDIRIFTMDCCRRSFIATLLASLAIPLASFGQGMDTPTSGGEGVESEAAPTNGHPTNGHPTNGHPTNGRFETTYRESENEARAVAGGLSLQQSLRLASFGISHLERAMGLLLSDAEVRVEDYESPIRIGCVVVEVVRANQPAARSGLKKDDMILSCNNRRVRSTTELATAMGRLPVNSTAVWKILREGESTEIKFSVSALARNAGSGRSSAASTKTTTSKQSMTSKPTFTSPAKTSSSRTPPSRTQPPRTQPSKTPPLKSAPARELHQMLESIKGL